MKKLCELCERVASVMCESDQARLCWGCDWKVHSANFLVGKHLRVLLCRVCQSPTPWNGSGPKLVPTVACCEKCVQRNKGNGETMRRTKTGSEEGCGSSNGAAATDDEMENQVVPRLSLSSLSQSTPN